MFRRNFAGSTAGTAAIGSGPSHRLGMSIFGRNFEGTLITCSRLTMPPIMIRDSLRINEFLIYLRLLWMDGNHETRKHPHTPMSEPRIQHHRFACSVPIALSPTSPVSCSKCEMVDQCVYARLISHWRSRDLFSDSFLI